MTDWFTLSILPIEGAAFVFWGGETKEQNYHVENRAQKHAIDFVGVPIPSLRYSGDGRNNEDFYIWDRSILAPADGSVVEVVDGVRDNVPKQLNSYVVPGNYVIIRHAEGVFSFLAHLRKNSASVREGDLVKAGQIIGRCGNSGRSSEPHLHFHLQNTDDMNTATGLKAVFREMRVENEIRRDYSPVRLDVVENIGDSAAP